MTISGKKLSERQILQKYSTSIYLEDHRIGSEETFEFLIIKAPDQIISMAETVEGKFLLVLQYRPAWERISIEFPAGTLNPGESMDDAVDRELREETGFEASRHEMILKIRKSASTNQFLGIYRSFDLKHIGQDLDAEENIEVLTATKAEIQSYIDNGQMVHMASILAFQFIK